MGEEKSTEIAYRSHTYLNPPLQQNNETVGVGGTLVSTQNRFSKAHN